MDPIKLPPRLALIASMVPRAARVADVGTDHGLLPAWLLENEIASAAIATDIRPGPLSRAESMRRERELQTMRCILCDGLQGISPTDVNTVIIAGMGGENIAGILQRAPWTAHDTLLLLQPMSRPEELRRALTKQNIRIREEHLTADNGRIYPIILAQGGDAAVLSPAEEYTGQYELVSGEELFLPMLDGLEKRLDTAISGLRGAEKQNSIPRLARLWEVREGVREMRRRKHAESF